MSDHDVGIVVVSHSRALAEAALALASEMLHGRPVRVELAAGLDETTLGTDAVRVKEAIESLDGPDGVVVLMDLGSAVLSAELALDLLEDPAMRDRVSLTAAPLVEGLVVATVTASGGAGRERIVAEAEGALVAKAAALSGEPPEVAHEVAHEESAYDEGDEVVGRFRIEDPHGLHARPAARLVAACADGDATVTLANLTTGAGPVAADSLILVMTLGAQAGHELEVRATGPDAQQAVDRIVALAGRRFDDEG